MAAPAGVNEGVPVEPVVHGAGGAESAESPAELTVAVPGPAKPVEVPETGGPGEAAEAEAIDGVAEAAAAVEALGTVEAVGPGGDGGSEGADAEVAGRRDLRPLAVTGIALGIIALVGVAVGMLAVVTHGFHRKTVITYRPAAVFSLRPGDCINSGPNGLAFTRLSCTTPHDAEVFATFSLSGSSWPGETAVQQQAGDGCAGRLSGYLNPALAGAGLSQEFVYPDRAAWQAGERTVVCEVSSSTGRLAGSVRAGG